MKCSSCEEDIEKGDDYYIYNGDKYCDDCMHEYVNDNLVYDAVDLWIEQNTTSGVK